MQSYYVMQLAFHDSFLSTNPSLPYSYTYGDRPVFEFCFLPNEIAEGDLLVFAVDNDMVFYDSAPENLLHSASCMVVVRHDVTAEEATAGKVQMRIETRTEKFRDVVNGKVRPVEVISGLYRRRGSDDDINYVLLAKGRAMANGIIADYDALPEPITTDEYYTKDEINDKLDVKADESTLVAHTGDTNIHVTQQDKTAWNSKADLNDIGNATITITQGGTSKGSFSVNASENVTIEVNDGAQADWDETDTSSPAYIQHKPSVYTKTETDGLLNEKADKSSTYTKTETDGLLNEKADKSSTYTKTETDGLLNEKANVATTLSGYGIQDAYTKTETNGLLDAKADKTSVYTKNETDAKLNEKANVATTYTKDETNSLLDGKADKATTIAGYGITDAYTKSEVDAKVSSVYRYKGTVSTYADLPTSGQEVGDVWNIETADSTHGIKAGDNVAWNGTTWDVLAGEIDLTAYATKDELTAGLEGKSDIDHLHTGKYLPLDANGNIQGSYLVVGGWAFSGHISTNGYVNANEGFMKDGVNIDNIYAAKSHTHAMGDITGLPASGGTAGQVLTKTDTGSEWADLPDENDYLCFTALTAGSTVGLNKFNTPPAINLEYSTDKMNWTQYTWNDKTGATITLANIGDKVWWRGDNTAFSSDDNSYSFAMSGSIEASGNVMSLLDKSCKSVTIPTAYCFTWLFSHCSSLITAPKLPATTMKDYCYDHMFYGCSSLIEAPELPATTLAEYCYQWMFMNCTSLTEVAELPATTMVNYCYKGMFQGCTSLTKAPELPATTLTQACYLGMFRGCTNINKIKVPFTSWVSNSTYYWLLDASSTGVFQCPSALDCSTRDVHHVPAGWTIVRTDAPAPAGTVGQVLKKTADGQEWADLPDENDYLCFTASQANSTVRLDKFGTPTINLEYSTDKKTWTEYTWNDKTGATITLANIGDNVWWRGDNTAFSLNLNNAYRFTMTGSIEASGNVMSLLDKTCKSVTIPTSYCFFVLFAMCASLKKAPKLPATNLADYCYYGMFKDCTSLMEAPELPATTLAEHCYEWMFYGCSSLTKAPELPATTMMNRCYDKMFYNCSSLTKAPELPATTLAEHCYVEMFQNCTNINKIKVAFTSWSGASNWLYDASTSGVFECPSALDCSTRDTDHVPAGWTIVRTDAPAPAGTVGQVLKKTADGQEWADLPAGGGEDMTDYLCFTASQANSTVRMNKVGTPPTINLEYSVDKKHWTTYTWDGNNGATITLANNLDSVWWRGNNNAFTLDTSNAYRFVMSGKINASGNIMSLLDKSCKSVTIPTSYCFFALFGMCDSLTKAPELPATTLAEYCYQAMFAGCSTLRKAPELPATALAEHCYLLMFNNCPSLREAPYLPATKMVNSCYKNMFQNCTSLTKAPELPATTLAEHCYDGMFKDCTSLREAPDLPATSVVDYCYENMFNGCNKLEKIKASFSEWRTGTSGTSNLHTENWLSGASSEGVFEFTIPFTVTTRDVSHVPAGWTIVYSCSPQSMNMYAWKTPQTQYWIRNNLKYTPVLTVASALTLHASTLASTDIAYTEIVLDVATGATVTAGTNMTLVDTPTAGKRNICVCRWSGGACKLYVTIVEDLPQA